ncbi:hypothetical protein T492DRAFT_1035894 [Pavlovales sp. CCMP2436]|nr:hypothetical protein T492DRAFT_1035894 [Pavlovales sp. CCMP2436]
MIAVGYMSNRHHSLRYGHIWDYLNSFYCAFVRTRAETQWTRPLRIFVPAGMVRCSKEHEASLALFGSKRAQQVFGFTMERAPWVPSCILLAKSCYVHGGVPEELRGQVTLFNDFRLGPFKLFLKQHVQFRDRVHDALGLGTGPPMSILYVRSSQWPTGRRVGEEEKVVAQLALWAAREHPTLSFRAEHVHWLSYVEEVAAFADARVLISLWGSSLHNCRYMRAGSLVVELHGALDSKFGDTTIYTQACSGSCGLLLAPYGVPGAFPRDARRGTEHWGHPLTNVRIKYDAKVARVDPQILVNLLKKIFPADPCALPDWLSVFVAYNAFLARQLHPRTQKPLTTLSREYTDKRWLPAQYRTPPWCNRTAAVRSITNASGSLRPVDNQGLMLRSDRATV